MRAAKRGNAYIKLRRPRIASHTLIEMAVRWWSCLMMVAFVLVTRVRNVAGDDSDDDLKEQLRVLSKQVTTLLERRKEDLQSIEDHMRRKLSKSEELVDVREEIRNLRLDIEQLHTGSPRRVHHAQHTTNQEVNDHKTLKWLSNSLNEVRTELSEFQSVMNSTIILQNREEVDGELSLLRTDVSNLNKELELARNRNAKYEAEILEIREELNSIKDHSRATSVTCGKMKNQLKAAQLEWNFNWKTLNEKRPVGLPEDANGRSSRHQRFLKKHVLDLEKTTHRLRATNEEMQSKLLKLEEEVQSLQKTNNPSDDLITTDDTYDRINGNEVENYLKEHKINEIKPVADKINLVERVANVEEQQRINTDAIVNLTRQFSNFDKLHLSMLELLENVENVENRVDKTLPEFRKEISKLEVQMSEGLSKLAALKEDQSNTRISMKAISVSVSNLQDKAEGEHGKLESVKADVENLKKSASVQSSKLHDHILKTESSTADVNATKSTIHLVQELKSFEKEYKSIVNKLPHDCNAVAGPNGIYLISPGDGEPILAYCSQGWTTIQKRYDGSVNFNRNWNDYSNGFGSATGEHWLGNRNLHHLTQSNCTKLEINMKDIYGKYWQATYEDFRVADFSKGFKLVVDKYHGNASDALEYQNRMEFSTVDNDRDISNTHCASNYEGGWWFSHCQHANLNGRYNLGLTWFDSSRNEWIAVATSEMRVKKRDVC